MKMCRPIIALAAALLLAPAASRAAGPTELPSFLVAGDAFCTNETDFDDYAVHGRVRPNSAIETCVKVDKPTRVAIMSGQSGSKSMIRIMNGPMAYSVGWTNGKLPLAGS